MQGRRGPVTLSGVINHQAEDLVVFQICINYSLNFAEFRSIFAFSDSVSRNYAFDTLTELFGTKVPTASDKLFLMKFPDIPASVYILPNSTQHHNRNYAISILP